MTQEAISASPARCGAHSRRSGQPCRSAPVRGGKRCRMHGGDTSRRPLQPARKHGLYAKVLPPEQSADYEAAITSVQSDGGVATVESGVALRVSNVLRFFRENPSGPQTTEEREALARALSQIDAGTLARLELLRSQPKPDQAISINVGVAGDARVFVRTADGPATALRAPDGGMLLPDGRGGFVPAIKRVVDGAEIYEPALLGDRADD